MIEERTPLRCRIFGHKMYSVRTRGNLLSRDRIAAHTSVEERKCFRCPYQDSIEHFHRRYYWAERERDNRIEEMAEAIRRAKR